MYNIVFLDFDLVRSILVKKYDLENMDVELICSTTCGNLNSYSRNIDDEGVRDYMKSLKSDFKRTEERV